MDVERYRHLFGLDLPEASITPDRPRTVEG
jgi:hypothetical protein